MRIRHLTLGLVSLGALILLCTVWWSGEGDPQPPHQPVITTNDTFAFPSFLGAERIIQGDLSVSPLERKETKS